MQEVKENAYSIVSQTNAPHHFTGQRYLPTQLPVDLTQATMPHETKVPLGALKWTLSPIIALVQLVSLKILTCCLCHTFCP